MDADENKLRKQAMIPAEPESEDHNLKIETEVAWATQRGYGSNRVSLKVWATDDPDSDNVYVDLNGGIAGDETEWEASIHISRQDARSLGKFLLMIANDFPKDMS